MHRINTADQLEQKPVLKVADVVDWIITLKYKFPSSKNQLLASHASNIFDDQAEPIRRVGVSNEAASTYAPSSGTTRISACGLVTFSNESGSVQ